MSTKLNNNEGGTAEKEKKVDNWLKSTSDTSEPIKGKNKRPWRNSVRKQAAKRAKVEEKMKNIEDSVPKVSDDSSEKKKKKRGPKKKKFKAEPSLIVKTPEPLDPVSEAKKRLEAGRFRFLNEKLYTCTGSEAFEFFKEDPSAFDCYHKGFADQVEKWPNHPLREIVRWLQSKPSEQTVFDLGCGEAKISEAVGEKHKIRSFDLVAVNDRVEACDMSSLPADDGSADIAIFCLSLMGTNLYDFIRESRRVLRVGGILKIAEVSSRFTSIKQFCEAITKMGFEMTNRRQLTDYFIIFEFRKIEKVEQKRPYGLKLKPCLYKKR
uniref:Ribosomal RNA-processing protein 8 n=1 Tax=Caenorhabditis japonica TaxID=281687 RepID=A0A8R1DUX6_CAEJA